MQNSSEKRQPKDFSIFPLAWLAAATAIGILAASFLTSVNFTVWLVAVVFSALFAAFHLKNGKTRAASVSTLAAFLFFGAFSLAFEGQTTDSSRLQRIYDAGEINNETPLEIVGVLQNAPEETIGGRFLILKIERIKYKNSERAVSGAVRVFVPSNDAEAEQDYKKLELRYGARIVVVATVSREERFRNLGSGEFRQFLRQKDLDAVGTLKSPLQIRRLDDAPVFLPLALVYDWRQNLIESFRRYFSPATASVLIASLLNNRYFLSKETAEAFREGGTFHILVISGLHITFIGVCVAWLVRKFTKRGWLQFLIANSLLWTYSLMVGAETPVTRAAFMFTVFHAAVLFYRPASSLNAFGAAGLILLAVKPKNLFDVSFLLTFASVAAIVACAAPLWEKLKQIGEWELSQATPEPPVCSRRLKILAEALFWSRTKWLREQRRHLWKCRLFKSELAEKIEKSSLQPVWRFVFGSILVSALVQMWLAPLMIYYFHRFTVAGLVLNLFVGVLIAVESLAALAVLFVAPLHEALAAPLVLICEALNWLTIKSVEPFSYFDAASFRIPNYSGWLQLIYVVYFAPLVALSFAIHSWAPFKIQDSKFKIQNAILLAAQLFLFVIIVFHPFGAPRADGRLRVDFLDVGQGDAALITLPDATTILVDGGGRPSFSRKIVGDDGETEIFEPDSPSIGEAIVSGFLWQTGRSEVDFLLPTHADTDHIDGLNDAAKNFAIKAALVARAPLADPEFKLFYDNLQNRKIPLVKVSRGQILEIGAARVEFLSPAADDSPSATWTNNDSVVFRLSYGKRSFLFTGDIQKEAERDLLQRRENITCDVVKVAHHGSRTSSIEDFVRAANARYAVVSVGRDSQFGHPHREVVERWRAAGAEVLTTGERGTISFSTDGEDLRVETFVKN